MKEPVEVKLMHDVDELVGKFLVLWRNETKQPAKVLSVDYREQRVTCELIGGPDDGLRASFGIGFPDQTVKVWDNEADCIEATRAGKGPSTG